jgi:xylem cysteine proteinase
MIWIYYLMKT